MATRPLLALALALLCVALAPVRAGGDEGPLLRGPFSVSGEPVKDIPFTFHWHPARNIASLFLRYPTSHTKDEYAYFAHVWSLDQDRVLLFYKGFNISFCHEYAVVGDVPRRFWHSVENLGAGKCENGVSVTWYEGKFTPLFVPYGIRSFRLGFDKSDRLSCVELVPYPHHKKDDGDAAESAPAPDAASSRLLPHTLLNSLLARGKGVAVRFDVDFDDAPPTMSVLLPKWLQRQCKRRDLGESEPAFAADEFAA